jgi:MFS transporter, putative metabolite:H+ symporter
MKPDGIAFHHPLAFWTGCLVVAVGVFLHMPMYVMAAPMHYHLAGMAMDAPMSIGMGLIPCGVLLAAFGLMPHLAQLRQSLHGQASHLHFRIADGVSLNREHWKLVIVLAIALTVDVMKPASIAFVMPGMVHEYAITSSKAGYLALSALTGTAVGSIVWGRIADLFGRRAAILLSALMFMGTAICGTMPAFSWNLVMCFLMGAAAGGMLPIAFTLMAETIPTAHRGWLLVALGGIGTSAGYLAASGAATLLEPTFSWRALWLLNLPTGALIVFLNRYIPESPRFLSNNGLQHEARAVLMRFAGRKDALVPDAGAAQEDTHILEIVHPVAEVRALLRGRYARISAGLAMCGLSWGLANFGFLLWLPGNLERLGLDAHAASTLMAKSALLAVPGIAVVVWMYQYWSSVRTLVMFIALSTVSLLAFLLIEMLHLRAAAFTVAATVALLIGISGVIATMIPYSAEIYPVHLRGTGSGVIAATSKAGGILGAGLGVLGLFDNFTLSAIVIAVPMAISGIMVARAGIETRGHALEAIQREMAEQR